MLTATSALHWEIRRSIRLPLVAVFFLAMLIPGLGLVPNIERQLRGTHIPLEEIAFSPSVHLVVTILNLVFILLGIGSAVGMPVRHFTLPIPTHTLAAIRMIPGAVCCSALYLTLSVFFNVLFGAGWPIVGPALTYGVAYMIMYATIYRFRGNDTRICVAGLVVGTLLLFWIGGHYGTYWWIRTEHHWSDLSINELLALAVTASCAWYNLKDGMERDRRGAGWGRTIERVNPASVSAAIPRRPLRQFSSSFGALFWQDWKMDGWLVPVVTVTLLSICAGIHVGSLILFKEIRTQHPIHGPDIFISLMGFLPLCAILPFFLGLSGQYGKRAAKNQTWPTGQSTLPLSDAAIGWVCVTRVICSSLTGAIGIVVVGALWFLGVEAVIQGYALRQDSYMPHGFNTQHAIRYLAGLGLTLWLTATFSTAATLTGRRWIAGLPLMVIPLWIFGGFISMLMPNPWTAQMVFVFMAYTLLALALVWTVIAYIAGIVHDVITYRSLLCGFLIFVLFEGVGISLLEPLKTAPVYALSPNEWNLWIMLIALSASPPALIPLATYFNRHR